MILNSHNYNFLYLKVTDKTRADIKGGTLIQYEGKVIFSMMQCFTSMKKHIKYKKKSFFLNGSKTIHIEKLFVRRGDFKSIY